MYFSINFFALVLVLLLAGNYVFGWGLPTAVPPGGDLPAPLDMSSTSQTKTGNLTIDSLLKVGRYTSAPTGSTGSLYYDTTENEFKGYKTSGWDSLGGGGVDTWITTQTCSTDYALQSVGKESKVCINKVDYSDIAYDLSCTDCIGPTEITDSYILNTSDAMSGNLTVAGNVGIGTTDPGAKLDVNGNLNVNGNAVGTQFWYAKQSAAVTATGGTGFVDIPGSNINFTLARNSVVHFTFSGSRMDNVTSGSHHNHRFVIDGIGKGHAAYGSMIQMDSNTGGWWSNMFDEWILTLAAGAHTVTSQISAQGGSTNFALGMEEYGRAYFTVTAYPQ